MARIDYAQTNWYDEKALRYAENYGLNNYRICIRRFWQTMNLATEFIYYHPRFEIFKDYYLITAADNLWQAGEYL